jgi:hypothetical protein
MAILGTLRIVEESQISFDLFFEDHLSRLWDMTTLGGTDDVKVWLESVMDAAEDNIGDLCICPEKTSNVDSRVCKKWSSE